MSLVLEESRGCDDSLKIRGLVILDWNEEQYIPVNTPPQKAVKATDGLGNTIHITEIELIITQLQLEGDLENHSDVTLENDMQEKLLLFPWDFPAVIRHQSHCSRMSDSNVSNNNLKLITISSHFPNALHFTLLYINLVSPQWCNVLLFNSHSMWCHPLSTNLLYKLEILESPLSASVC